MNRQSFNTFHRDEWAMFKRISLTVVLSLMIGVMFSEQTPQTINITAKRFEFSPNEITVRKGQPVTLLIDSTDVAHGLVIKDLHVQTEIKKGSQAKVTFSPTETGDFTGNCAHFCGAGHGKMHLIVHVRE
jgi:cytochrome c oxidase subunit II